MKGRCFESSGFLIPLVMLVDGERWEEIEIRDGECVGGKVRLEGRCSIDGSTKAASKHSKHLNPVRPGARLQVCTMSKGLEWLG